MSRGFFDPERARADYFKRHEKTEAQWSALRNLEARHDTKAYHTMSEFGSVRVLISDQAYLLDRHGRVKLHYNTKSKI